MRLQLRLGMNKTEFSRIRIAIIYGITYEKPEYLEDDGKHEYFNILDCIRYNIIGGKIVKYRSSRA